MPDDVARRVAHSRRGLIVAPAGCGKTHLIADSVTHCTGRQLILTHTHAGVRAIIDHLRRRGIDPRSYRVSTIDGFALRYACAFSSLSGWSQPQPTGDSWSELRPAAAQTLRNSAVRRVVSCSYTGVYVDEYQDCSVGQHDLVLAISDIVPVRVLGDPLQSVFWKINDGENVTWKIVESEFPLIDELSTPHRWANHNYDLGQWLLDVRKQLLDGKPIDLRSGPISWKSDVQSQHQLRVCLDVARNPRHSILGLRAWGNQCHQLARSLNGAYRSMETVECDALHEWVSKIESSDGVERVRHTIGFAKACIARLPQALTDWLNHFATGGCPRPRRTDYQRIVECLCAIRQNSDLKFVEAALSAVEQIEERLVYARLELWREMQRTLAAHRRASDRTLSESAWHQRNRARHIGRRVDRRCLATTLLAKGLEFDHAVILNVDDLEDAENLYVAMTRGSRSLTVLSSLPVVRRELPHFVS